MNMRTEFNDERRHELVGLNYNRETRYDVKRFEGVDAETVKTLIDEGYLEEDDSQNASPTALEIYNIMSRYPGMTAHGYIVTPSRSDCRVTLEGVEYNASLSKEDMADIGAEFECADTFELSPTGFYCWYD